MRRCLLGLFGLVVAASVVGGCRSVSLEAQGERRPFSVVVLPDTQNYTDSSFGGAPEYFYEQTKWIRKNRKKLNIVMVAHAGDIVQHARARSEWEIASEAFETIDGVVPYILCLGNHDIADDQGEGPGARETLLNDYFPPSRFIGNRLYRKHFEAEPERHFSEPGRSDNYYLCFAGGGMRFLIMALEFKPRNEVLAWANEVVAEHPEHRCIVVTHGYLDEGARRRIGEYAIEGNGPEEIWEKLVSQHENMFMVLCGHILGESVLTSAGAAGNAVHQILADYQNDYVGQGGGGYLRIMTFIPDEKKIEILTYSPSLGAHLTRPKSQFVLEYE
jgi:hypothetical protein